MYIDLIFVQFILLSCVLTLTCGIEESVFSMPSTMFCNSDFGKDDESGVLITKPDWMRRDINDCVMSFRLPGQEVLINFEKFSITDCSIYLYVYAGASAQGSALVSLDCYSSKPSQMTTVLNDVSFRVIKPNKGVDGFKWRIILTAIKSKGSSQCDGFQCDNGNCIDSDLHDDYADHCGDGSDEKRYNSLFNNNAGAIIAPILVTTFLFIAIFIGAICFCRHRQRQRMMQQQMGPGPVVVGGQAPPPPPHGQGYYPVAQPPPQQGYYPTGQPPPQQGYYPTGQPPQQQSYYPTGQALPPQGYSTGGQGPPLQPHGSPYQTAPTAPPGAEPPPTYNSLNLKNMI